MVSDPMAGNRSGSGESCSARQGGRCQFKIRANFIKKYMITYFNFLLLIPLDLIFFVFQDLNETLRLNDVFFKISF